MNIFLIGYRATGKTSIGRTLAHMLKWDFADSDTMITADEGQSITEIVEQKGWACFRQKEKDMIELLCRKKKHIIATGGGVVEDFENIQMMKKSGSIIWLTADPETIRQRIEKDEKSQSQRPALTGNGMTAEIMEVLTRRIPLYKQAMNFHVDTDNRLIETICDSIYQQLNDDYPTIFEK
ncbi:shikimate kinase [Desulfobacterales bacterium HSG16]|nr:shikimate kinase [Desulfobacterales bacterium HSG16]